MIIDFFELIQEVLSKFGDILQFFDDTRGILESMIINITDYNVINDIRPFLGTIRYITGDTVYLTLARALQVGMFIVLVRALYELVVIILYQLKVQKPLSWLKEFIGL